MLTRSKDDYVYGGLGQHWLYLEENFPEKITRHLKDTWFIEILYLASVNVPRFAILLLYHRLFTTKVIRRCIYTLAGIMETHMVITLTIGFLMCIPLHANWDYNMEHYKCLNIQALQTWTGVPNIITDLCILILPLPVIWRLHTLRFKVGLTFTFLVGSL